LSSDPSCAHVAISHNNKQVWFNFPTGGATYCNLSLVWDLDSETMGVISYLSPVSHMARGILGDLGTNRTWSGLSGSWDDFAGAWSDSIFNPATDSLLFSRYTEDELNYISGSLRDGDESAGKLQLLSKDFGQPTAYKTIDRVYITGEGGTYDLNEVITGRIGTQEHAADPINWSPPLSLYRDKSLSYGASGRLISLELSIRQRDEWRISSFDVHYMVSGP
ncbi:MAG: hypothetical protein ACR2P6_07595, partial [Gammaproteobacteria bacterium]